MAGNVDDGGAVPLVQDVACNVDKKVVPIVHEELLRPSRSRTATGGTFTTVVADVAKDSGRVHR